MLIIFSDLLFAVFEIGFIGISKTKFKSISCLLLILIFLMLSFALSFAKVFHIGSTLGINFCLLLFLFCYFSLVISGWVPYFKLRKFQKDLDELGLKTSKGNRPKVIRYIGIDEFKTKLIVHAKGIGLDKFENRKSDLRSTFQEIIESIESSKNQKYVEIFLTKRALTTMIFYSDLIEKIQKPYHILIGESMKGVVIDSVRSAPHYLISGSTGGGKSVFVNSALLSLARSTLIQKGKSAIQFYLIDLKRGIEVKPFGQWPNVKIAKTEMEALKFLQSIRSEMYKRYDYLDRSKHNIKQIEPKRDKRDIIILLIDEASVIFGKTKNKEKMNTINKCREVYDELCKLARASGIHIFTATQKPISDSIDTKSLENLNQRIAFKMSTHGGSMTALGNSSAYKLPDIKGRCIWKGGNTFLEVQAPFVSEDEVDEECRFLAQEFAKPENGNYQKMLGFSNEDKEPNKDIGVKKRD